MPRRRLPRLVAIAVVGGLVLLAAACTTTNSSPPASTPPGSAGVSPDTEGPLLTAGMNAANLIDPAGDAHEQEWLCLGLELQRDPAVGEGATQALDKTDVDTRKKLLKVFADCVGPDALIDIYVTGHGIGVDRRDCVKQLLLAQSLDDQISVVAGDGDAPDVFAKRVASQCAGSTSSIAG